MQQDTDEPFFWPGLRGAGRVKIDRERTLRGWRPDGEVSVFREALLACQENKAGMERDDDLMEKSMARWRN